MKQNEVKEILNEINVVYGDKRFPLTAQVGNVWMKYIGECNYKWTCEAVRMFVEESEYAPTIADILKNYKQVRNEHMENSFAIWEEYKKVIQDIGSQFDTPEFLKLYKKKIDETDLKKAKYITAIFADLSYQQSLPEFSKQADISPYEVLKELYVDE